MIQIKVAESYLTFFILHIKEICPVPYLTSGIFLE